MIEIVLMVHSKTNASKDGDLELPPTSLLSLCKHMFEWVCTKLWFGTAIGRLDFGFDRRYAFITVRCEING